MSQGQFQRLAIEDAATYTTRTIYRPLYRAGMTESTGNSCLMELFSQAAKDAGQVSLKLCRAMSKTEWNPYRQKAITIKKSFYPR
jgi:hypothetical protein